MKNTLLALLLAPLAVTASWASSSPEIQALRADCASSYSAKLGTPAADEHHFVYAKGQYKGEHRAGQSLACTESQYAAYLDKADPGRVMAAYPSAAGRPKAK
ncbi:hypothetical protein PEC18_15475 [Paucibacter sp. O1-1]|uniref:hypothetical protein n=1 Tax=Roseateles TaxID=93681 RepID=UPI0010F5616A|nr:MULTISPECIES: hypothetical protein [unclassified Roseateles]MCU7372221.1 hypothetical protein [Paucibacter sp. O1-1]MCZ7884175.1 hypothetical protein [Paucibacter sp. M5-1]MDA3827211.1 hypothetical protein [Paucibacter sp. O1-1]MDC6167723.1 hypothetical protein [Paucibacter sp. XJ19-41]